MAAPKDFLIEAMSHATSALQQATLKTMGDISLAQAAIRLMASGDIDVAGSSVLSAPIKADLANARTLVETITEISALIAAAPAGKFWGARPFAIQGFSGTAMEPYLSPDGNWLFWNNSHDPDEATLLHYGYRTGLNQFVSRGPLTGINSTALDAGISIDADNNIFWTTTRDSVAGRAWRGKLEVGPGPTPVAAVTNTAPIAGDVKPVTANWYNMDTAICSDGTMMVFTDNFGTTPGTAVSTLKLAGRNIDQTFSRLVNSDTLLAACNTDGLNYAPSLSPDLMELYFTRASVMGAMPLVMVARRTSLVDAFGAPVPVDVTTGHSEAAVLSGDGKNMLWHKQAYGNTGFGLWWAQR